MIKLFYYFNLEGEIIDDPMDNPATQDRRLAAYGDCMNLFEMDSTNAKFKLRKMGLSLSIDKNLTSGLAEFKRVEKWNIIEETHTLDYDLKTKQVNKPASSFYSYKNKITIK
ncbi:MAG: hypothetical protein H0X26_01005 [Alphaproteobacteria bacterium]|nr:hypothetical protein [Alphaproteobacteria bacterium]